MSLKALLDLLGTGNLVLNCELRDRERERLEGGGLRGWKFIKNQQETRLICMI